ncbi:MAG: hypothetical protein AAF934_03040 [Bacteroidota bacterium]
MSKVIMVPVHLDGFFLEREKLVTEAFADFSRLPFSDTDKDYNPDTANISESILSQPFQNTNLNLKKGMHLHWSLPDALTKGSTEGTADKYPAVPNRWLIQRNSTVIGNAQWVVESDYLQSGLENTEGGIAYPMDVGNSSEQPFRYMGRQLEATGWSEDAGADRLSRLTAMGYGEPAFAAFYPNCHSVFGCFDPDVDSNASGDNKLEGLSYQLIGWYSDTAQDPLAGFLTSFLADNPTANQTALEQAVQDQFAWNVTIDASNVPSSLPSGIVCYAELSFNVTADANLDNSRKSQATTVSIGNTGTEALSAYLAGQRSATPGPVEEQLEHLLLHSQLQDVDLDLYPRFREARHEKGFNAVKGGSLWEIKPANQNNDTGSVVIGLPSGMSDALDELNGLQQQADRAEEALTHQRHILFADWYKYMLCAYPPDDSRDDYPDIDYVKWYIENQTIPQVEAATTDLNDKQSALVAPKAALETQISDFNSSVISKTLLLKPLETDTADTSGMTLTNTTWQDNDPFSTQCLYFNGSDAELSITGIDGIKALSLWVNLATQNATDAALLATGSNGALIAKDETVGFWDKICINGLTQPIYESFQWSSLPKDQWFHLYIEFTDALTSSETLYMFSNNSANFLTGKLAGVRLFNDVLTSDELYYDQNMLGHEQYELKEVAAPRFWQPNEPVVLIEGDAIEPTTRHGEDGRLNENNTMDCPETDVTNYPLQQTDFSGLLSTITNGAPASGEKVGYDIWSAQPWHPFLLEWKVELFPMSEGGNSDGDNRDFDTDFIIGNYSLEENNPELSVQSGKSVVSDAAVFSGRTVLTPYAKKQLAQTITSYLNNLQQEDCYQVISSISDADKESYNSALTTWFSGKPTIAYWYATDTEYTTAINTYKTWYESKPVYNDDGSAEPTVLFGDDDGSNTNELTGAQRLQDFNYALIESYIEARASHFISQALSGFNNAMLMHHQTLQLPVYDPLGFEDYRSFTDAVSTAVGDNTNVAPLPLNDFLPIRSGAMRLLNLRVIDSFGQTKTIDVSSPVKAEPVALPDTAVTNTNTADLWLPPRFVQPVRLNFRWRSATTGSQELNSHPESSPVCGWLLANHLDNSIAVYDQQGYAIGIIDQEAKWRGVPGSHATVDPSDLDNEYLQKVIERLALVHDETETTPGTKQTFLEDFITVTDKALENIDPENFIHHQELALLMGRPIAVVRASLKLELKGDTAIHHGWTEFRQDLERTTRETNGFEDITIPVRIGERGQLNDGVLGYWKEDANNTLDTVFHTTIDLTSVTTTSTTIEGYQANQPDITQSLSSDPQVFTLLVDPRSEVHATTGMLPMKSINIPKEYYTDALKKINITFLSAPILTGADQIALPLPNELGYRWSWLAKDRHSWTETANTGILRKDTLIGAFSNGDDLWTELLDKGWIATIDNNRAGIVPRDQRTSAELDAGYSAQTDAIEAFLDAGHIIPVNTRAIFSPQQTLKEGWLKLSPSDN